MKSFFYIFFIIYIGIITAKLSLVFFHRIDFHFPNFFIEPLWKSLLGALLVAFLGWLFPTKK